MSQPYAINGDLAVRVAVDTAAMQWTASPSGTVWRKRVHLVGPVEAGQVTSVVRYEPGSHHPFHKHEFAQVWYIVEGEFRIGERTYGPGTMLFYPDPHFEDPLHTETGGVMLFVQYQGPTTGGRPIYEGRFNMTARKRIEEENVEV